MAQVAPVTTAIDSLGTDFRLRLPPLSLTVLTLSVSDAAAAEA